MARIKCFTLTAIAALVLTVCGGNALANDANTVNTAKKTAPGGPTKVALAALENSAYEAWKSKDARFWDTFLSDKFVGWGSSGRLDKASATKEYTGADCAIKSYALSDEQMNPLGKGAALITYKITVDGTCGGQPVPANSWAASVYVRDADKWKGAFHAEAPIVDPKAALAKPADKKKAPQKDQAQPAAPDTGTNAMLAIERTVWEAWRAHDGKQLEDLTAKDISFINIFGTYFASKADALKDWTGTGCDVKSVSVTKAVRTMLSPTTGILTFKATADGTCYGQEVNSVIWGTSVYIKDGDVWKWTFGINVPARGEGT
jgi:ketosteroid isomerase-like protein